MKIVFLDYKKGFNVGNMWIHHPKEMDLDDENWKSLFQEVRNGR